MRINDNFVYLPHLHTRIYTFIYFGDGEWFIDRTVQYNSHYIRLRLQSLQLLYNNILVFLEIIFF